MSDLYDRMVVLVASQAHEDWRAGWRKMKGDEPRVKETLDASWSTAHSGSTQVNIAATAYDDLPEDWKGENKMNALICVGAVLGRVNASLSLDDSEFLESAAAEVHTAWVSRNSWADDSLKVPYGDLPEEEKEKDRLGVRRAIAAYTKLA